jgi:hypothetical protein
VVKIGISSCLSTQWRCRPAAVIEFSRVVSAGWQIQSYSLRSTSRQHFAAGFQGLDKRIAITANAQAYNPGLSQVALRRIKILIEQFALFPTALVAFFSNG